MNLRYSSNRYNNNKNFSVQFREYELYFTIRQT